MISRRLFFAAPLAIPGIAAAAVVPKISDVTLSKNGWADINFNYREEWRPKRDLMRSLKSQGLKLRSHFVAVPWGSPALVLQMVSDVVVLWDHRNYTVLKDRTDGDWKITWEMEELQTLWACRELVRARERRVAAFVKRGSLKV